MPAGLHGLTPIKSLANLLSPDLKRNLKACGECRWNYIDSSGRGFESRQGNGSCSVAQWIEQKKKRFTNPCRRS